MQGLLMYLLTKNTVKSWNYYGGDDSSTLIIKLQHNIDTQSYQLQSSHGYYSFGYKKKSPAQFRRDTGRLDELKQGFDNLENKSPIFTCHGENKVQKMLIILCELFMINHCNRVVWTAQYQAQEHL